MQGVRLPTHGFAAMLPVGRLARRPGVVGVLCGCIALWHAKTRQQMVDLEARNAVLTTELDEKAGLMRIMIDHPSQSRKGKGKRGDKDLIALND